MKIDKIKTKKLLWIHIEKPTRVEIDYLKKEYDFHPLDLEDCLVKVQRPQMSEYSHYDRYGKFRQLVYSVIP